MLLFQKAKINRDALRDSKVSSKGTSILIYSKISGTTAVKNEAQSYTQLAFVAPCYGPDLGPGASCITVFNPSNIHEMCYYHPIYHIKKLGLESCNDIQDCL